MRNKRLLSDTARWVLIHALVTQEGKCVVHAAESAVCRG